MPRLRVGLELQRDAVHAVALARGLRTVVEDVAQMPAAAAAMHLRARVDQLEIARRRDRSLDRREEARPPGAAVEFGLGAIELQRAGRAREDALAVLVIERAREGPLRAVLAEDPILLGRQFLAPFGVGGHGWLAPRGTVA